MPKVSTQMASIPNLLSILRIVLIPFFILSFLGAKDNNQYALSSAILIVSGITDMLDGAIARRFNMVTDVGKILDPVADKLTQLSIIICLSLRHPVTLLLFAVFAVKEIMMLAGGVLLFRRGIHPGGAKWFGKLATGFFYVSMIVLVLLPGMDGRYINAIIIANMALLLFSLSKYIPHFFRLKKG